MKLSPEEIQKNCLLIRDNFLESGIDDKKAFVIVLSLICLYSNELNLSTDELKGFLNDALRAYDKHT